MSETVDDLVRRAKALPNDELEPLLKRLVEPVSESADHELHPAWDAEIGRRLAAYDNGECRAIDANEVFAKAAKIAK